MSTPYWHASTDRVSAGYARRAVLRGIAVAVWAAALVPLAWAQSPCEPHGTTKGVQTVNRASGLDRTGGDPLGEILQGVVDGADHGLADFVDRPFLRRRSEAAC